MQTRKRPFGDAIGCIDRSRVRCLDIVLRDDIHTSFTSIDQVLQAILRLVESAREPEDEERRVMVDDIEVAERGEVGA